jgi:hypothetical protein
MTKVDRSGAFLTVNHLPILVVGVVKFSLHVSLHPRRIAAHWYLDNCTRGIISNLDAAITWADASRLQSCRRRVRD